MHLQKKIIPFGTFLIVANPATFKLVRKIAGSWVASAEGLPTTAGLVLHAVVFVVLCSFLWKLVYGGRKSGYEPADVDGDMMAVSPSPAPAEAVSTDYSNLFSSVLGEAGMKNFDQ
jgi:hypothetical protein